MNATNKLVVFDVTSKGIYALIKHPSMFALMNHAEMLNIVTELVVVRVIKGAWIASIDRSLVNAARFVETQAIVRNVQIYGSCPRLFFQILFEMTTHETNVSVYICHLMDQNLELTDRVVRMSLYSCVHQKVGNQTRYVGLAFQIDTIRLDSNEEVSVGTRLFPWDALSGRSYCRCIWFRWDTGHVE